MDIGTVQIKSDMERAGEAMERAGEAIKNFNRTMTRLYNESRYFRLLIKWENFKFDVKHFCKETLPLWVRYRINKIKNPGSPWTMR